MSWLQRWADQCGFGADERRQQQNSAQNCNRIGHRPPSSHSRSVRWRRRRKIGGGLEETSINCAWHNNLKWPTVLLHRCFIDMSILSASNNKFFFYLACIFASPPPFCSCRGNKQADALSCCGHRVRKINLTLFILCSFAEFNTTLFCQFYDEHSSKLLSVHIYVCVCVVFSETPHTRAPLLLFVFWHFM